MDDNEIKTLLENREDLEESRWHWAIEVERRTNRRIMWISIGECVIGIALLIHLITHL